MRQQDSESWTKAKAAGDRAENVAAEWWASLGLGVYRALGRAPSDIHNTFDVEVKNDLQAERTGHVAVEVSYGGQPSGVITSAALFWQIEAAGETLVVRTDLLRKLALDKRWREVPAGDRHRARVRLVPLTELRRISIAGQLSALLLR